MVRAPDLGSHGPGWMTVRCFSAQSLSLSSFHCLNKMLKDIITRHRHTEAAIMNGHMMFRYKNKVVYYYQSYCQNA